MFIDCQADSLEMDYEKVRAAINAHTKAIVPVDLGGVPCDYDKIFSIVTDSEVRKLFTPLEADESDDDLTKLGSRISGFKPDVDIPIVYTGLRPGEKLYEEKLMVEEGLKKTANDLIYY